MRAQTRVQGRFLGGRPPYGYRLVDGGRHPNPVHGRWGRRVQVLAPDPVTAPWVRWMFAERARGRTVASLARELNERGVVCPSGADPKRNAHRSGERWIVRTVAMILENPRYTGRQVWNRSSTTGHGPGGRVGGRGSGALRYNPVSEWEVSERIAHEPLVDDETFVAVQGLRLAKPSKDGEVRCYMLAGLVVCGLCGRRMDKHWVHGRAGYRCRHGVRFDGATFNGIASFDRTTLAGAAWFDGTIFNGPAGFHRATLAGSAWFDHTTFAGDAWFDGATFIDSARFGGATFTGVALFGSATFTSSARFEGATFTSGASFNRTTFRGDVCFDRVTFKYKARFDEATFNKSAQFFGATFNNSAQFDGATFTSAVWFDRATFPSYARLGGAVFTSTATCRSARIQLAEGCTSQGTWPEGWTCVPAESSTSEDGQWMQLVPVPVVLDRRVVVDARTEES
ncbi:pentapeptide repeat-containing protein [Lentzea sp. NPDC034063]|uniref:pentapeptide repeat-containing protein n=1 Tax=unclassified Lentzea TaxID=2643253 RepID=UPI0033C2C1D0